MHQISFGGRAPPGPTGGAAGLPQTPSCIKGCLSLREGKGELGVGRGGEGRKEWGEKG